MVQIGSELVQCHSRSPRPPRPVYSPSIPVAVAIVLIGKLKLRAGLCPHGVLPGRPAGEPRGSQVL